MKSGPESWLWISPKNGERIAQSFANYLLKKLARRAGIAKKAHPHAFRHAISTHLAKILTEQQLKVYCGWVNDSRMASVYVHLSGKDVDEALLKAKGIAVEHEEKPQQTVKVCSRCSEPNSALSHFCKRCGNPLDIKVAFETERLEELLIDFFKVLGECFPKAKEKFLEVAKNKNMFDLFMEKDEK